MDIISRVLSNHKIFRGKTTGEIVPLQGSGSNRRYFRIFEPKGSVIAVYNEKVEENDAFIGFTNHFRAKGLPVPELYYYDRQECTYFLEDLGRINLFEWLSDRPEPRPFGDDAVAMYKEVLNRLVIFQTKGIEGLDMELCYPHKSFDGRSMIWDMNYFKYMFLNLMGVPYHEHKLEHDFEILRDYLLSAPQDFFLYRDFQSANVMIRNEEPWFIDYQGGRRGALQYDPASLLYDPKAHIPEDSRELLINHYLDRLEVTGVTNRHRFMEFFPGFAMIRLMQALGAFGFRGLYETKPTFTESIVPAVGLLNRIVESGSFCIELKELSKTIKYICSVKRFRELELSMNDGNRLTGSG